MAPRQHGYEILNSRVEQPGHTKPPKPQLSTLFHRAPLPRLPRGPRWLLCLTITHAFKKQGRPRELSVALPARPCSCGTLPGSLGTSSGSDG